MQVYNMLVHVYNIIFTRNLDFAHFVSCVEIRFYQCALWFAAFLRCKMVNSVMFSSIVNSDSRKVCKYHRYAMEIPEPVPFFYPGMGLK